MNINSKNKTVYFFSITFFAHVWAALLGQGQPGSVESHRNGRICDAIVILGPWLRSRASGRRKNAKVTQPHERPNNENRASKSRDKKAATTSEFTFYRKCWTPWIPPQTPIQLKCNCVLHACRSLHRWTTKQNCKPKKKNIEHVKWHSDAPQHGFPIFNQFIWRACAGSTWRVQPSRHRHRHLHTCGHNLLNTKMLFEASKLVQCVTWALAHTKFPLFIEVFV